MIFPSEKKKELWRYASKNNPATCDADGTPMPMQQPQLPHPQHPRHPQLGWSNYCCCAEQSTAMQQLNTPPPPYSSIACSIDCSGSHCLNQKTTQNQEQQQLRNRTDASGQVDVDTNMTMSVSASEESDYSFIKGGCSYESSGVDMLSDENGLCPLPPTNCYPTPMRCPPTTTTAATFAMSAANIFRNCCGGGGGSGHTTDSSTGSNMRTTPPASRRPILSRQQRTSIPTTTTTCPMHPSIPAPALRPRTLHQKFDTLLKPFKSKQINELLQAVKSRADTTPTKGNSPYFLPSSPNYLQCILIKRNTVAGEEEHHFTTCQLFFWSDLRFSGELKRLPICQSAIDSIYICCNPLHWYRIMQPIDTESAPPPYQRTKMLRQRDADSEGNSQNIERSSAAAWPVQSNSSQHSKSISSIIKQAESQLFVPSLESFTTDGKDRSACSVWCKIAYWELGQRVGDLFNAKKSAVNIYADGPVDGGAESSMCLRDLVGKRPSTDAVQNTRQKIGLGATLSLEGGDVWIYNRSNVPIFVDSPTLAVGLPLDRVCKVLPGYCLKAFETQKAQRLAYVHTPQNQLGPIDRFCMKISFAKGWGNSYKRQEVMGCPCWMEVHFSHLR